MVKFPAAAGPARTKTLAGPARAKTLKVTATEKIRPCEFGPDGLRAFLRRLGADPCTGSPLPGSAREFVRVLGPKPILAENDAMGRPIPSRRKNLLNIEQSPPRIRPRMVSGVAATRRLDARSAAFHRARAAIVSRSGDMIGLKKTSTGSLGKARNRGNGLWVYLIASRTDTAHRSFGIRAGRKDSSAKIAWRRANGDPVPAVATHQCYESLASVPMDWGPCYDSPDSIRGRIPASVGVGSLYADFRSGNRLIR